MTEEQKTVIKEEIISVQDQYISFLDMETAPFVAFCATRGMTVSKEVFDNGEKYRERIKSLKEKLNQ